MYENVILKAKNFSECGCSINQSNKLVVDMWLWVTTRWCYCKCSVTYLDNVQSDLIFAKILMMLLLEQLYMRISQ